ncbi:Pimeloyl-ACP methyl ester carboxylesterase [Zunongwangia mangrovi]|uniref:Pimeloyl-ACP methyl ester carboxylesterase n=1 Tax=Zunongwangia mangrovi TaxID=1334022 RepID=A0A1I1D1V4_9FLAO|nr:alpha/beta fold hydrolase [Zunongwangia mangrovi]SFB68794.1 Pimeloyl-ACP methyl ester carboxylesterase [Zunongwangia mangrovi]
MKLHTNIIGEGKPFIILHGFLGMGDNWKTLGKMFSEKGYEVHLVDQRNHGKSPHSDDFTYQVLAEDLKEYVEEHNLDKVVLMGHSMGGKTAMLFATTYPDLLEKLIIVDIAPKYYRPHHQDILAGLSLLEESDVSSRQEAAKIISEYVPDKPTQLFLLKNLDREGKDKYVLKVNLKIFKEKIDNIGKALGDSKVYEGETLFIKGENSNYIKLPEDEELLQTHFPSTKIEVISNAGHWVHAENQKDFYDAVIRFL